MLQNNFCPCKGAHFFVIKPSVVKIIQAGGVAAPVGGQIFSEILPYLEVSQGNQDEIEQIEQVSVPNIEGMSIKEAEKVIKEVGLEISISNDSEELDKENVKVVEQTPKEGVVINKGSKVYIHSIK